MEAVAWRTAGARDRSSTTSCVRATRPRRTAGGGGELEPARRVDLLAYFSGAFDLAESQPIGHACRVAKIALGIERELKLAPVARRRVINAALLHDAGVSIRTTSGHLGGGAWVAERFGLDAGVKSAIRATHERWDGKGRPAGIAGDAIPIDALVLGAAHWASDHVEEPANPLRARAQLQRACPDEVEAIAGPRVTSEMCAVLRDDGIWIALWTAELPVVVVAAGSGEGRPSHRKVERAAAAMGDVNDAAVREPGRSHRVASLAGAMASALGFLAGYTRAVTIAGYLIDVGQLGAPRHITEQPSILSVDEMEQMRRHPGLGSRMLATAPGLGEIPAWVEAHHERPDGRGYPGMLTGEEVPVTPRILAVADAYCALRADRPYRSALSRSEALSLVRAGAGGQFDAAVVGALTPAADACEARWVRERRVVQVPRRQVAQKWLRRRA